MAVLVEGSLSSLPTERLEAELCTWAGHIAAATCRWLRLVAEYDRREAWVAWECTSMAQWLSVHVGMSVVTARQHVAVARRLDELPLVATAFGKGELSYSKVRALCRVATPATEATFLDLAREATAAQLDRIVADTSRALRADDPDIARRQAEAVKLDWWTDDDGLLHFSGVALPEVGATFTRLIGESVEPGPLPIERRRGEAFAQLLTRVDVADPEKARRPLVVIHTHPDGTSRLEGGPPLPASVAATIDGDETTATHHPDGRITYSRKRRRTPNRSMRRHVLSRDRCCAFPGCRRTDSLQTHHIAWYGRDHGETTSWNLVALCPKHHRAVHVGGWTISGDPDTGTVIWHRPDGRRLDPGGLVTQGDADAVVDPEIGPDTVVPRSGGARYDHELTVWILANHPGFATTPPDDAAASCGDPLPADPPADRADTSPGDAAASPNDHGRATPSIDEGPTPMPPQPARCATDGHVTPPSDAAASPNDHGRATPSADEVPTAMPPQPAPSASDTHSTPQRDAAASPNDHGRATPSIDEGPTPMPPQPARCATDGRVTPPSDAAASFADPRPGGQEDHVCEDDDEGWVPPPYDDDPATDGHGGCFFFDDRDEVSVRWSWPDG